MFQAAAVSDGAFEQSVLPSSETVRFKRVIAPVCRKAFQPLGGAVIAALSLEELVADLGSVPKQALESILGFSRKFVFRHGIRSYRQQWRILSARKITHHFFFDLLKNVRYVELLMRGILSVVGQSEGDGSHWLVWDSVEQRGCSMILIFKGQVFLVFGLAENEERFST